jgi:ABC-type oligopeptide transport system substrate-binding subunit
MQKLALLATALAAAALLSLAACNPADSVSEAHADARPVSFIALHPAPAADARDGAVYEYH